MWEKKSDQELQQIREEFEHRERLLRELREFKEKALISPPHGSSSVPNNDGRIISCKRKRIRMRFGSRINFFYSLRKIIRQCRFCGRWGKKEYQNKVSIDESFILILFFLLVLIVYAGIIASVESFFFREFFNFYISIVFTHFGFAFIFIFCIWGYKRGDQ